MSDRTLGWYYLYEKKTDKLTKLADRNPWLKEEDLSEMKPIEFKSRDGLLIHGYLTLPKGASAKRLPVVVIPHGGPWARDVWGFDPEVQFLANRGYAVLQMNFRGSTGYGRKFWEISFKQWGKTMQDDISDGVKWIINQGIADPQRVAIYGGSYGGYATLAGLTFSPELYTCGVDYVGVSNLFTFMKTIPPYWKPYLDMFHEMVGDPQKDSTLLASASPVFHVDNIKVPLLVAQGAKDPRVNINESNQIVDALKKKGIDVTYLVKENEGHGFHNEENRFDFYEAMEKFLAKHLLTH
jgi:dipeptidyl aminopeptidase/acylaminoacyl peptidase